MLVEPRPWRGFQKGGFLRLRAAAMRTHGCDVQREAFLRANRGLADGVLAGLDAMGRVPWSINGPILDLVQEAGSRAGRGPIYLLCMILRFGSTRATIRKRRSL